MNRQDLDELFEEHRKAARCPSPLIVSDFFRNLLGFMFPEHCSREIASPDDLESYLGELKEELLVILSKRSDHDPVKDSATIHGFINSLPSLKSELKHDIDAIYEGDPAARSVAEVVRAYPGFYAIASYRIAHALFKEGLGLIARMITEHAHSRTGIDIHPGARIGSHFCIDHGTGIVIGETTEIGNYVKVYQGVTLGALSVRKEDAAVKRHPTIEDHVIIYAGASILGGDTVVGYQSTIGGNVWLTESVPPFSKVYYKAEFIKEVNDKRNEVL